MIAGGCYVGSYCALKFDDIEMLSWKSEIPDELVSLFQEPDRLKLPPLEGEDDDEDDSLERTTYAASRDVVLHRLSIMGFTESAARRNYEDWRTSEVAMFQEWLQEGREWAAPTLRAIRKLSYDRWKERVPKAIRTLDKKVYGPRSPSEKEMKRDGAWLFFEADDIRTSIRALVDACPSVQEVSLDISDLIWGGWLEEDEAVCTTRREPDSLLRPVLEPTVMMAEGTSDIRVLKLSLRALYPHLVDYFTFFDHEELSVEGGASYLVKFLKALGAARMPTRLVAIFDNDTIGLQAFRLAGALRLPSNISVLRLPDVAIARDYPTVGPQGAHLVDINGKAGGIELYLGRQNLLDGDGELMPVRWTGYVASVGSYQGALESKNQVLRSFEREISNISDPAIARARYPELVEVWEMVFRSLASSH